MALSVCRQGIGVPYLCKPAKAIDIGYQAKGQLYVIERLGNSVTPGLVCILETTTQWYQGWIQELLKMVGGGGPSPSLRLVQHPMGGGSKERAKMG